MIDHDIVLDMRKFVVPEVIFGNDSRFLAGRLARNYGARKALVVTDPGVMAAGWTAQILEKLQEAGIETAVFSDVSCNPRSREVMAGAEVYKAEDCNAIIAVGGGSPMDCAKGIGIVTTNGGDILEYEGVDEVTEPLPLMVCVPTTAGTAADVSQFAIITDEKRKVKIAIISKTIVPDVALLDPIVTSTMSPQLAAATGVDALTHAIEAYVSLANSPLTDVHALDAIRLIAKNLPLAVNSPDVQSRGKMMLASLEAGLAFSNASLGAVHAMAHSVGGLLDFSHGECNAMMLLPAIDFNFPSTARRYRNILDAFGEPEAGKTDQEAHDLLLSSVRRLLNDIGVTSTLTDMGVHEHHLLELAEAAHRDPCLVTNPRPASVSDLEKMYRAAL